MSARLNWRGDELLARIADAAVAALDEIDGRIVTEAQKELYPGHGKRSGRLQRGIQADPAALRGDRVRGVAGVRGVPYARRIHRRYGYMVAGLRRVAPLAPGILKKHVRSAGR